MRSVHDFEDFVRSIQSPSPIVAVFEAAWCGDCHYLAPAYPEIEAGFEGKVDFLVVDIDEVPSAAKVHQVSGIPSFVLFESGDEIFRLVNPRRKTREEVIDFIEQGLTRVRH